MTISEFKFDFCHIPRHEPVVLQCITQPSTAHLTGNWTCSAASRYTTAPISYTRP